MVKPKVGEQYMLDLAEKKYAFNEVEDWIRKNTRPI